MKAQSPNHWTAREFPIVDFKKKLTHSVVLHPERQVKALFSFSQLSKPWPGKCTQFKNQK